MGCKQRTMFTHIHMFPVQIILTIWKKKKEDKSITPVQKRVQLSFSFSQEQHFSQTMAVMWLTMSSVFIGQVAIGSIASRLPGKPDNYLDMQKTDLKSICNSCFLFSFFFFLIIRGCCGCFSQLLFLHSSDWQLLECLGLASRILKSDIILELSLVPPFHSPLLSLLEFYFRILFIFAVSSGFLLSFLEIQMVSVYVCVSVPSLPFLLLFIPPSSLS